ELALLVGFCRVWMIEREYITLHPAMDVATHRDWVLLVFEVERSIRFSLKDAIPACHIDIVRHIGTVFHLEDLAGRLQFLPIVVLREKDFDMWVEHAIGLINENFRSPELLLRRAVFEVLVHWKILSVRATDPDDHVLHAFCRRIDHPRLLMRAAFLTAKS